jgi:cell division cycle 2-like protein
MERCPTDLAAVMAAAKLSSPLRLLLSLDWIRFVMSGVLRALRHLHDASVGIIHRDVKPGNILLARDGCVRLSDFGSARFYRREVAADSEKPQDSSSSTSSNNSDMKKADGRMTPGSLRTTLLFASPEALLSAEQYGPATDMWSLGVTFAELLLRNHLFKGRSELMMLASMFQLLGTPTNDSWPEFASLPVAKAFEFQPQEAKMDEMLFDKVSPPLQVTAACKDLLARMLVINPSRRITAAEALQHPFFAERDYCDDPSVAALPSCLDLQRASVQVVELLSGEKSCTNSSASRALVLSSAGDSDESD